MAAGKNIAFEIAALTYRFREKYGYFKWQSIVNRRRQIMFGMVD